MNPRRSGLASVPCLFRAANDMNADPQTEPKMEMPHRLFVPSDVGKNGPVPLLVALHGCHQTAADFAAGTRFDEVAARYDAIVVYPEQSRCANGLRCWNWFKPAHQARGEGEPAAILRLVEGLARRFPVDRDRVYIAGLSAGGAMAAILAEQAPDVFAAVGIMAGVALHSGHDALSAYAAMAGHQTPAAEDVYASTLRRRMAYRRMRAMIWTGSDDTTVAPANAALLADQYATLLGVTNARVEVDTQSKASVSRWRDARGRVRIELWTVNNMRHAWSGGSWRGSYTYPRGPHASEEMFKFFIGRRPERGARRKDLAARVRRGFARLLEPRESKDEPAA